MPIGAGLPDLLIVSGSNQLLTLANADFSETEILAFLRVVRRAALPTIAASTRYSEARVARALSRLQRARAVAIDRKAEFRLTSAWRSILPEIIAIEVKVNNWQRAISQAARNRIFTHRSYIALPAEVALRIRDDERLAHFGIGVLSIAANGEINELRKSKRVQPRVWSYYYKVASLAARHIRSSK